MRFRAHAGICYHTCLAYSVATTLQPSQFSKCSKNQQRLKVQRFNKSQNQQIKQVQQNKQFNDSKTLNNSKVQKQQTLFEGTESECKQAARLQSPVAASSWVPDAFQMPARCPQIVPCPQVLPDVSHMFPRWLL